MGVVFVKWNQTSQAALLANTEADTTPGYRRFLRALGWRVKLNQHKGFSGGLKPGTDGSHSMYSKQNPPLLEPFVEPFWILLDLFLCFFSCLVTTVTRKWK